MIFKSLSKLGMERNFINLIKIICKMSMAHIILKSEILKGFFPYSGKQTNMPVVAPSIQHWTGSPSW